MQEAVTTQGVSEAEENILDVYNLKKYFPIRGGVLKKIVGQVKAVDGISFSIKRGETLGLVGESGCGKSTTGRTILRLLDKTDGEVYYQGKEVFQLSKQQLKEYRQKMQIIFQDPYSSLNPRLNVSEIVGESLKEHGIAKGKDLHDKVKDAMEKSGLQGHHVRRYPHEFSGGQRQRIGIARALALDPDFIVADEPVSALDVSIQSQILNLMMDLQDDLGFTFLFISHDLGVVKHISDRIGVMYLGNLVELADKNDMFENPSHPYTRALLSAIPSSHPRQRTEGEKIVLKGTIPSPANPPSGCKFHPRCPEAHDRCSHETPEMKEISPRHFVECHLF